MPTPEERHYLRHGDQAGELECAWCEKMRPAEQFFGCEKCGRYGCAKCLTGHEPCDGTHPEGLGQSPRELLPPPGEYVPWNPRRHRV